VFLGFGLRNLLCEFHGALSPGPLALTGLGLRLRHQPYRIAHRVCILQLLLLLAVGSLPLLRADVGTQAAQSLLLGLFFYLSEVLETVWLVVDRGSVRLLI